MKSHAKTIIRAIRGAIGKPLLGTEIGVWKGELSENLLAAFPMLTLRMVDPWARIVTPTMREKREEFVEAERLAEQRTSRVGWRRIIVTSTGHEAAEKVCGSSQDFVVIDACHLYESVAEDTRDWWPKLRPGGLMLWHDYGGLMDRRGRWGVKRAVDEFLASVGVTELSSQGITAWARRED